jgi:hypothetical protein
MKATTSKKNNLLRFFYHWHRRVGLIFGVPALLLSITGLTLNYSKSLQLDQINIANPYIISWYGMLPKSQPVSVKTNDLWASTVEDVLYLNSTRIQDGASSPTGISLLNNQIAISTENAIYLIDYNSKELIEKLDGALIPPGKIIASSFINDSFLIDTTNGQFSSNSNFDKFDQTPRAPLIGPNYSKIPKDLYEAILIDWRGNGLSLWRIIIDIHSGSFFGKFGSTLINISSTFIIFLVLSGFYTWIKKPSK